ncbi:MAG: DEAD/DEAH box helicase [Methanosphaera sp.]|uniref:DEAD/DEAH box helicase n=1 Tax=Methanosphaera sp. TaxID=2666342 RepID=UPI0025D4900A|nr:DEAD/DEAH box helicase [Methanosphaera sp.]MCI5867336.1 DEAD/DEAH box helicase [Methanosphaera sp.]MDD6534596.1 DEAD/DEAH box helicase [Methanosphaera sp.]MDY3955736.1 DEAD/DEAH box helicase [Methanosphaera sp.]
MEKLKFKDLNISEEIQKAVEDMGFEEASPIQSLAIPKILAKKDVIGQAQTGTGKTAAFGIPLLENINEHDESLQAIILCPTRELAIQVAEELRKLAAYLPEINVLPVYGGQPIDRQIKALKKGVQIIIGTPGRVMDHISRGTINLSTIKTVILDEADEMLDMGFRDDIEYILEFIPDERQFLLFSATLPGEILQLAQRYQNDSEIVKVTRHELTTPDVDQKYFEVKEDMKLELLSRLLDINDFDLSLVFCNTKRKVDKLVSHLQVRGYLADGLHGDLTQNQRDHVMRKFKNGNIEILVATDVAARGIDVGGVEGVFNYDIPNDNEYYVHRIGRTGRAGKTGKAFSFVSGREIYQLRDIQRYAKTKIEQAPIPSLIDVEEVKKDNFIEELKERINTEDISKETYIIEKLIEEDYNSIDIAATLLKGIIEESPYKQEEFGDTDANEGFVRFFMSLGRKQNITISVILNSIYEKTALTGRQIGNIDIFDNFSFIEIPQDHASDFYRFMGDTYIDNKRAHIEPAKPRDKSNKKDKKRYSNKRKRKSNKFNPHKKDNNYHGGKNTYRKDSYNKKNTYKKHSYQNDSYKSYQKDDY